MQDETCEWITPMLIAASERQLDLYPLLKTALQADGQIEADGLMATFRAGAVSGGATFTSVDWVRFGAVLRDALGWEHYPADPRDAGQYAHMVWMATQTLRSVVHKLPADAANAYTARRMTEYLTILAGERA